MTQAHATIIQTIVGTPKPCLVTKAELFVEAGTPAIYDEMRRSKLLTMSYKRGGYLYTVTPAALRELGYTVAEELEQKELVLHEEDFPLFTACCNNLLKRGWRVKFLHATAPCAVLVYEGSL